MGNHLFVIRYKKREIYPGKSTKVNSAIENATAAIRRSNTVLYSYINDIADGLSSTVRLFADYTMIYLAVKNVQDARIFQEDLDKLTTWEKR